MYVKSLQAKGFRSFQDMTISFEHGITTIVGENNTGKSSIALALSKIMGVFPGNESIVRTDYPYSIVGPLEIKATISLSGAETEEYLRKNLIPSSLSTTRKSESPLHSWLRGDDNMVTLALTTRSDRVSTYLGWNGLYFAGDSFSKSEVIPEGSREPWENIARTFAEGGMAPETFHRKLLESTMQLPYNITTNFARLVAERFKITREFSSPTILEGRSSSLETMSGAETASVLLNLKNHRNPREKARYRKIIEELKHFFPGYDVDAVESSPGGGSPDIQFSEVAHLERILSISQMSAGVQQITFLITNLVALEGLILFIQHPETLLHPHARRALYSLLVKASERNQIIVVTHDPYFVDPRSPNILRRVWWTPENGTQVLGVWTGLSDIGKAQIETALRQLSDREIVFARAVLLVEDESLYEFLVTAAPKLGYDLDAHGVSVRFTGGDGSHRPYHTVLKALGIPHVNLRDKSWGDNPNFPPDRFISLGMEFEDYVDSQGLAELRKKVSQGGSHRRQAAALAAMLEGKQVPPVFGEVLKTIVGLATGHPSDRDDEIGRSGRQPG